MKDKVRQNSAWYVSSISDVGPDRGKTTIKFCPDVGEGSVRLVLDIHRRGPSRSFEAVEYATLEWVDWFNHRRLLEPIGNIPPAEAEDRYYASLEQPALAA